MKKFLPHCLLIFALGLRAAESALSYDVRAYGATGDGRTLDTAAIQKTIDACAAAGGGVVYFPTGRFLSGSLRLKSDVTLRLSPAAVLLGSTRVADYPSKHLLYAQGAEHIAIDGGGTIDGQGDAFFDKAIKPLERIAQLIEIDSSRHIRLESVTVRQSGNWTFRVRNCEDVKVRGVSMLNNVRAENTDGLQICSSRNVIISDCHIEGGDDCIVLKSDDAPEDGPVENVTVTNCVLVSAACALKVGTGTYRDFRHCLFSNCVIRDSRTGIALMMKDGGTIEDVRFSNIVMTTLPKWGQGLEWPIVVDVERRTNESKLGHIRDVSFDGITVYSQGRILAEGMAGSPIEGLTFRDVVLRAGGYEKIEGGKKPRGGPHSASSDSLDYGATPAAFIFAHIKNLHLDGVRLAWPEAADAPERNAIFGDQLDGVTIANFRGTASRPEGQAFNFKNCKDVKP